MKDKKINRPRWCYDKKAKVLYSTFNKEYYEEGYGRMKIPREDDFNKVKHINDICHCYYTPFKGAIRYFINKDDVWGETHAKIGVMNRIFNKKCHIHKEEDSYLVLRHSCPKCAKEEFEGSRKNIN